MSERNGLTGFYHNMAIWLRDVKKNEVTQIVELIEHAKSLLKAAESIPEEKVRQFIANFVYDLHEFYRQNQEQAKHSVYLGLMNESFWAILVNITDKSQVEWAELCEDFEHNGDYKKGDVIGFGQLCCKNCDKIRLISHLSTVDECLHCGHHHFTRQSLAP